MLNNFLHSIREWIMGRRKNRKSKNKAANSIATGNRNTSASSPKSDDVTSSNTPPQNVQLDFLKTQKSKFEAECAHLTQELLKKNQDLEKIKKKFKLLEEEIRPLRAQANQNQIEQRAQANAKILAPKDAPDYPLPQHTPINGSTGGSWHYAYGSVQGSQKSPDQCQDRSKVVVTGDGNFVILTIADGAGSLKHSHTGAEEAVTAASLSAQEELEAVEKKKGLVDQKTFNLISHNAFQKALNAISLRAETEKHNLAEYGSTLIMLIAGPDFTACAHIGDGRAGCCLSNGQWLPLISPMKGGEANMTKFLTHLSSNPDLIQVNFIPFRSSAVFCISDGCESASWFTKTKAQYCNNGPLVDPNVPSATFWGSISAQLVSLKNNLSGQKLDEVEIQTQTNNLFKKFLLEGNAVLASERDDKTIALAVNLS